MSIQFKGEYQSLPEIPETEKPKIRMMLATLGQKTLENLLNTKDPKKRREIIRSVITHDSLSGFFQTQFEKELLKLFSGNYKVDELVQVSLKLQEQKKKDYQILLEIINQHDKTFYSILNLFCPADNQGNNYCKIPYLLSLSSEEIFQLLKEKPGLAGTNLGISEDQYFVKVQISNLRNIWKRLISEEKQQENYDRGIIANTQTDINNISVVPKKFTEFEETFLKEKKTIDKISHLFKDIFPENLQKLITYPIKQEHFKNSTLIEKHIGKEIDLNKFSMEIKTETSQIIFSLTNKVNQNTISFKISLGNTNPQLIISTNKIVDISKRTETKIFRDRTNEILSFELNSQKYTKNCYLEDNTSLSQFVEEQTKD